jgi:hypothetical protein
MTAPKKNKIILDKEAQETRKRLIKAASQRKIFTYSDLVSNDDDRHMNKLSKTLAKISCFERNEERPFMCDIVVLKKRGYSGTRFFVLCADLGINKNIEELQEECFEYLGSR